MKARFLGVLFILIVSAMLNVPTAQASIEPIFPLDNLFTALNTGEIDMALAAFAEDAVVENLVRGETYRGAAEIGPMLQAMQRENRQYEIVRVQLVGDTITVGVEISDQGQVWGMETLMVHVKGGKLQTLEVTKFQLKLYP